VGRVGAEELGEEVLLRLQFVELLPAQRAFVRQVVEELAAQAGERAS
jgi:hypothetical protein